jgi:hypothetical protein
VRLESVLDPQSVIVSGDPARLQQVFWNLLSNAVKFTPKGGRIQVLLQRVNSHIEFSVSDTGIGIPASFLPHVFERFSQKDSSTHREYGGLGLGLAICKQLVDLHGGSIQGEKHGRRTRRHFRGHAPAHHSRQGKGRPSAYTRRPAEMPEAVPVPRLDGRARARRRRRGGHARTDSAAVGEPGRARDHRCAPGTRPSGCSRPIPPTC